MRRKCRKCSCPLTCLAGEVRRICVRCRATREQTVRHQVYYAAHREDRRQYAAERYERQRPVRLLQAAAYYLENREAILAKKRQREALAVTAAARTIHD